MVRRGGETFSMGSVCLSPVSVLLVLGLLSMPSFAFSFSVDSFMVMLASRTVYPVLRSLYTEFVITRYDVNESKFPLASVLLPTLGSITDLCRHPGTASRLRFRKRIQSISVSQVYSRVSRGRVSC